MRLSNENILKMIFCSTHTLFEIKQKLNIFNNTVMYKAILSLTAYYQIYKSLGRMKNILSENCQIYSLTRYPSCNIIITASRSKHLKLWDVNKHYCIKTIDQDKPASSIVVLPDGNIASCTLSDIKIWDAKNDFKCIKKFYLKGYSFLFCLILLANGNMACATETNDNYYILIIAKNNYKCVKEFGKNSSLISCLTNLPFNKLASGGRDKTISIWDINDDYKCVGALGGHNGLIQALCAIPQKNILLSTSTDKTIKVWDIINYVCLRTIETNCDVMRCLLSLPGGYFASGYYSRIKIWDLGNFECLNTLESDFAHMTSLLLMDDGRLISSTADGKIIIWYY
jgi:WD40 repeat protein